MNVEVPRGKYILAVSGGVDSMALLHMLAKKPGLEIIVAHFNHGIRDDSDKDEALVGETAEKYGLVFESGKGKLGPNASEDTARKVRYEFLEGVQKKYAAAGIITAHHQDDMVETALLNLIRGTGRRGLSAIADNKNILRPLLNVSKPEIMAYAKSHNLKWREDATNQSLDYLRNRLRLNALSGIEKAQKQKLISYIEKVAKNNAEIDNYLATLSRNIIKDNELDREKFSNLPLDTGSELLVYWLRTLDAGELDRKTIARLSLAIKTARAGSIQPVKADNYLKFSRKTVLFSNTL